MRSTFAPIAFAALAAASPMPQGVTSAIAPSSSAPAGCSPDYDGQFSIQVVNVTSSKRSVQKRQDSTLVMTLSGGVLTDDKGRTGYIAANNQFQFDSPPQTGAIYTSGFSACSNGSLAIGGDAMWKQCLSGTFYNLYDENGAAQCSDVYIDIIGGGSSGASASVMPDGQPTASAVASQQSDGQPTESPVASQQSDGQVTASPIASPVSQISDGQIQATTAAPVSQISDGQVQATSAAAPVSQISDGQVQATTAAPVSQISDGQIQASTAAASAGTGAPYAGANSTLASPAPSASVQPATGGASTLSSISLGLVGAIAAVLAL